MIDVYFGNSDRDAVVKAALGADFDKIAVSQSGKPYIEDGREFNISHSGNVIVCAVAQYPVGIDIELIKPRNTESILRCFSVGEADRISELAGKSGLEEFYRCWTAKEAYGKFRGVGISREITKNFDYKNADEFVVSGIYGGEYMFSLCTANEAEIVFHCEDALIEIV